MAQTVPSRTGSFYCALARRCQTQASGYRHTFNQPCGKHDVLEIDMACKWPVMQSYPLPQILQRKRSAEVQDFPEAA